MQIEVTLLLPLKIDSKKKSTKGIREVQGAGDDLEAGKRGQNGGREIFRGIWQQIFTAPVFYLFWHGFVVSKRVQKKKREVEGRERDKGRGVRRLLLYPAIQAFFVTLADAL